MKWTNPLEAVYIADLLRQNCKDPAGVVEKQIADFAELKEHFAYDPEAVKAYDREIGFCNEVLVILKR